MALVTRENIGLLHDKLTVTVSQNDYQKNFDNALKKYAKNANIPGFRKGMVPTGLVKKMYGNGVFVEEVVKAAENELYNYLQNEKLDIFAQPLPTDSDLKSIDFNNPQDYSLNFEIGLKPNFSIDAKNFDLTKFNIEVEEKMVEEEIERLQKRFGVLTEPTTVTNDEDMLNITFEECDENGNVIEGGASKQDSLLLKYFKADFRKNLLNKAKDEFVTLTLETAFEDKELSFVAKDLGLDKENAEHLKKHFKATITKIGFVEKAELNEKMFAQAFPNAELKTEADFRAYLKQDISKALDMQSRNQLHDQIYHCLLDKTTIDLPEGFLKRWLQTSSETPKTTEEVENEYPSFANSLKWTVITNKVAEENNIKVEQNDLKDFAKQQLFSYMGMNVDVEEQPWVEDYLNRMMKDKKFVEDSFYKVQTEKIFAVLESQVSPKQENIKYDEFAKKLHHHHH